MMALALLPFLVGGVAAPPRPVSLCEPAEVSLFTCPIRRKMVAICGINDKATYRYGTPGHIELSSNTLHIANRGTSGGGETQISFSNNGFTYVVFDRTVRTAFAGNGNAPDFLAGLAVRRGGKTISISECGADASISVKAKEYIDEGSFIEH